MTTRLPPGVKLGRDSENEMILSDSPWAHPEAELPDPQQATSGVTESETAGQTRRDNARKR